MGRLEVRLLGPVEVVHGARPVKLARRLERALLARLALDPGRPVPTDRLVDDLWGERLPRDPVASLQALVSRLRRTLDDTGSVVTRRGNGYVLDVPPDSVDAVCFEQQVRQARSMEASAGSAQQELLESALRLWRGDAFGGIEDAPFVSAQRTRLAAGHLTAIGDRIDAELELGRHLSVIDELQGLVAEHPHEERFWGQLMLAFYRRGAQADALRCFQRLRTLLAEDLGINPGPAVTRLERAVLAQDPALDWRPPPDSERPEGERSAAGARSPGSSAEPVPLVWSPRSANRYVGRQAELQTAWRARQRAQGERVLLLVTGEAGIGKTRFVAEFAARAAAAGDLVVHGRWDEDALCPYQAFREALSCLASEIGGLGIDEAPRSYAGDLARVAPEIVEKLELAAPAPSTDVPDLDRHRIFRAVDSWISEIAERRRLVLVLDDLQWADRASLRLLEFLLLPLETITLDGLSVDEAGELLGSVLGSSGPAAPASSVRNVHRQTRGNPFFLEALAQDLSQGERSLASWESADWNPHPGLGQLREVVHWRLRLVSRPCRDVLSAASAVGDCFSAALVCQLLAGCSDEPLLSALDEARLAGLVLPRAPASDDHCFAHGVVRRVLYEDMSSSRRIRLRDRMATLLETQLTQIAV
jgi:DNA-binding SARP family transcriptional activator